MARGSHALDVFRALGALLPAVPRAERNVPFRQRALYTGMCVSVFVVCSHLRLYGVSYAAVSGADPMYRARSLLGSTRGSLMELGVAPVVTAGTVTQLLRVDREDLGAARKALAMAIALGEAAAHVLLGMYGSVGVFTGALIVAQLFSGSLVVVFLDELFDKGHGLPGASAISLLLTTNTCKKVVWQAFSPVIMVTGSGAQELEGIVTAAVARAGDEKLLLATLFRRHRPNVLNLLGTCLVLLAAVFLEGFRVLLPMRRWVTFPIKLLYTSAMPVVLHSAIVAALCMVSQMLHYSRIGRGTMLARLLGTWNGAVPVGGLAYYVTPPSNVNADPLHALAYAALLLTSCTLLSQAWTTASGSSATDVAKQLEDQRLAVPGTRHHDVIHSQLHRYIPTATALGGLCVGALTILADVTGAIGSRTGILLAATVVYNLVDNFRNENY